MTMRGKGRYIVLIIALGVGGYCWMDRAPAGPGTAAAPVAYERVERTERVVPKDERIRVEVYNASQVRGLARRATFFLRDLGFDVVASGTSAEQRDSTVVIVRSGRMDWGELAAKSLGGARVEARPDSSRYVDLTILVGATWRPPAQTFHP